MATRKTVLVYGINGVAPGSTATVTIPTQLRYHSLNVSVTDNGSPDFSKIKEIRLVVDGVQMQRFTPDDLDRLYRLNLNTSIPGNLFIPFSEITRATVFEEEVTAYQTFGVGKFEMQVDIDPSATAPTLRVLATQDATPMLETKNGQTVPMLRPIQISPYGYTAGAGWLEITTLPSDAPIQAIYVQTTTAPAYGDITAYEVYRGQEKIAEGTHVENNNALAPYGYDATQFVLPIIFDREHQVRNALDCRQLDANGNQIAPPLPLTLRLYLPTAKNVRCLLARVKNGYN